MPRNAAAFILTSLTAVALTACAAGRQSAAAEPLTPDQLALLDRHIGGKVAGDAVACIDPVASDKIVRVSESVVLYRASDELVYKNDLRGSCTGLLRSTNLVSGLMRSANFYRDSSNGGGACGGDAVRVADRETGLSGSRCTLGEFTPYRAPSDN